MRVVFLDQASLGDDLSYESLSRDYNVKIFAHTEQNDLLARVENAEVIITNKVVLNRELILKLSHLKLIIVIATGTNNIDLDAAKKCGVQVINAVGYAKESVAYNTFAHYFALNQNLKTYYDYTAKMKWSDHHSFAYFETFRDLSSQTWGVIGLGSIGEQVAKLAQGFGARVIYFSPSGKNQNRNFEQVSLNELLDQSHIISIHTALVESTRNLITVKEFSLMKNCHTLLNLARGEVIDEFALKEFLENSDLKVGLDVLTGEPDIENSILKDFIIQGRVNLTPHMSWASVESRQKLLVYIEQNLKTFFKKN